MLRWWGVKYLEGILFVREEKEGDVAINDLEVHIDY
jgi:hypothetical protein